MKSHFSKSKEAFHYDNRHHTLSKGSVYKTRSGLFKTAPVGIGILIILFAALTFPVWAAFPVVSQGNILHNDTRLNDPIGQSKPDELTIASFNIRNLGSQKRSLKDFQALISLVDEADVFVIQEVGLLLLAKPEVKANTDRLVAVRAIFQAYLGDNWLVMSPPKHTGMGNGAETTIIYNAPRPT